MAVTRYVSMNGRIRGETASGTRTDYLTDALGSVTGTVNGKAELVNAYRYKPYGARLSKSGSGTDPRYQWTGDTGSRSTNLNRAEQYNVYRHYGHKQAQWTTVDLLWPDESAFAFCSGMPVQLTDPTGLRPSNCRQRTQSYCLSAQDRQHNNYGYNCFCFVSGKICDLIDLFMLKSELKGCARWLECVNKCLFDCVSYGAGCGPSATSCWQRVFSPNHDCSRITDACLSHHDDLPSDWSNIRSNCCRSMVTCEQTQYSYCNRKGGACERLNETLTYPPFGTLTCSRLVQLMGDANAFWFGKGTSFPFGDSEGERIGAAKKLCCRDQVWFGRI